MEKKMFKAEAKVGIFKEEMICGGCSQTLISYKEHTLSRSQLLGEISRLQTENEEWKKEAVPDSANQLKQTAKWASRPWIMCRDTDKTLRHVSVLFSRDVKGAMYSDI